MINQRFLLLVLFSLFITSNSIKAQEVKKMSQEDYIRKYAYIAVNEMIHYGIPASITLSQGILESGFGNSDLVKNANNHFGIKCHLVWEGKEYYMDDDEADECFRKYPSSAESFRDHSDFLKTRERYQELFKLKATDYKGWAHGLKKAGYATNPQYASKLISLIERHQLHLIDKKYAHKIITSDKCEKQGTLAAVGSNKNCVPAVEDGKGNILLCKNNRKIFILNKLKVTEAIDDDTPEKMANDLNMFLWQITKYNEIDKKSKIKKGSVIYLQPKRSRAEEEFHIVKEGETIQQISQYYGIKKEAIYKKNNLIPSDEVKTGIKLYLRNKKKD